MLLRVFKSNFNIIGVASFRLTAKDAKRIAQLYPSLLKRHVLFRIYDQSHSSNDTTSHRTLPFGEISMDDLDWYEKDLDEFDPSHSSDDELLMEQQAIHTRTKQHVKQLPMVMNNGNYPFDFWYLIATYIAPEDIGRFALICRTTNQVVNTVSFWIYLFRKTNKNQSKRVSRMLRREQLAIVRPYVIRSLYEIYPLFKERLNKSDAIQKDPHFLLASRCVRIWYSKRTTPRELYNYYFEFRFATDQPSKQEEEHISALSPLFQTQNQYQIAKDSCVLHLISSNFVPIGPYMGMILSQIVLNVSGDYRYHKLKMWFDSSRSSPQTLKYNQSSVIIDPILSLRLYKWFNSPATLD